MQIDTGKVMRSVVSKGILALFGTALSMWYNHSLLISLCSGGRPWCVNVFLARGCTRVVRSQTNTVHEVVVLTCMAETSLERLDKKWVVLWLWTHQLNS